MLTERQIKKLVPRERRYSMAAGDGLTLIVHPSGTITWLFRYYDCGLVRDLTLGNYPELSLAQARQMVRRKRLELKLKPSKGITFGYAIKNLR